MKYEFTFAYWPKDEHGQIRRDRTERVVAVLTFPTLADAMVYAQFREQGIGCGLSGGPNCCWIESFRWIEEPASSSGMSDGEMIVRALLSVRDQIAQNGFAAATSRCPETIYDDEVDRELRRREAARAQKKESTDGK